jgi:hypothetical protein
MSGVFVAVRVGEGVRVTVLVGVTERVMVADRVGVGWVPVSAFEGVTTGANVFEEVALAVGASVGVSEPIGVHDGVPSAPNSDS